MSAKGDIAFPQLWSSSYDQAIKVAERTATTTSSEETTSSSDPQHKQRVMRVLDSLTNVIFGLDTEKKAAVVSYRDGALELIVSLTRSTDVLSEGEKKKTSDGRSERGEDGDNNIDAQLLKTSFKAIKTCVVRNPVGRSRSRSAGVFSLADEALISYSENVQLVEEIMTTVAAVCLGDDLNTLQGAIQLRENVDRLASLKGDVSAGLKQKKSYLIALFEAVSKEQESLVKFISDSCAAFFDDVATAETELRAGNNAALEDNFELAESHYNSAMERVASDRFPTETKLLDSLRCQLYWNRANVRFKLGKTESALHDTDMLLKNEVPSEIAGCAQRLRAKAFSALGRDEEAHEAAGKALVIDPQDEDLQKKLAEKKLS